MELTSADILEIRLRRQLLEPAAADSARDPAGVVAHLCCTQAQDYPGTLWAIAQRCSADVSVHDVESAIEQRRMVRTWPMRGTLHFVAPQDVRWLLTLLASRVVSSSGTRQAQLGLSDADIEHARGVIERELSGGRFLTRPQVMALFEANRLSTAGQRGYHLLWHLAQRGVICLGPMAGKQQTFVLLDEWVPAGPHAQDAPPREEALARLAARYLEAHGPATVEDLAWWAGLPKSDVRAGLAACPKDSLERLAVNGTEYWLPAGVAETHLATPRPSRRTPRAHLLPTFDEYMLGYTGRHLQLGPHREAYLGPVSANGMFSAPLVIDGRVVGAWRRTLRARHVEVTVTTYEPLGAAKTRAVERQAERFARFTGRQDVRVRW